MTEIGLHFGCSDVAVGKALRKLNITRKKKTIGYIERSEEARKAYQEQISEIPKSRRIYVDESGVHEFCFSRYARSFSGKRVYGLIPGKKFSRTNIVEGYCDGKSLPNTVIPAPQLQQYLRSGFANFYCPKIKMVIL